MVYPARASLVIRASAAVLACGVALSVGGCREEGTGHAGASTSAAPSGSAAAPAGAAGGIPTKEASPSLAAEGAPLPADADPEQVLIAADRAATSARYVHVDGWVDHQGRKVTVDADLTSAPAAAGWISEGGDKVLVRYVGGNVYARGSSALYEKYLGQRAARRVGDRWLMVPASGREYQQVTGLASPGGLLTELFPDAAGARKTAGGSVGGTGTVVLTTSSGSGSLTVAATGTPYPLVVDAGEKGRITFSDWGEKVSVTAPPRSQVVDVSTL
ncbi:MAG: hypothetical protein GXX79_01470 [Actinomycetales bacterium]|nr:hypothetical protein [Actinomycetales bacterium]